MISNSTPSFILTDFREAFAKGVLCTCRSESDPKQGQPVLRAPAFSVALILENEAASFRRARCRFLFFRGTEI